MEPVTIYGFAPSTYTRSARMAAIEKGIAHELVPMPYGEPAHFDLHPFGKMPAMTAGAVTVFETTAIILFLDEASGSPTLFGASPETKVNVLTCVSVAIDYAYRPLVHIEVKDGTPDATQLAVANRVLDWMEARLGQSAWLAGPHLTAADLFLVPMLAYHANVLGADQPYVGRRPRLKDWIRRISMRPSFQETA